MSENNLLCISEQSGILKKTAVFSIYFKNPQKNLLYCPILHWNASLLAKACEQGREKGNIQYCHISVRNLDHSVNVFPSLVYSTLTECQLLETRLPGEFILARTNISHCGAATGWVYLTKAIRTVFYDMNTPSLMIIRKQKHFKTVLAQTKIDE